MLRTVMLMPWSARAKAVSLTMLYILGIINASANMFTQSAAYAYVSVLHLTNNVHLFT